MNNVTPIHANAFSVSCPSRTVLDLLADKWSALIFCALAQGPQRYGALRRRIEGVSAKMLSQTLQALERDGLLSRQVFPAKPPQVEYTLTPMGMEVLALLNRLREWSEVNVERVIAARQVYERKRAT